MLKKRIIPCLDIKNGRTVKGVNFVNLKDAGDPVELAIKYEKDGADELVFLDITATIEKRKTLVSLVEQIASKISIPFTVGGGINSLEDAKALISAGADKIAVNSSAVSNPRLISTLAKELGSQCVVLAVDTKRVENEWRVFVNGGRTITPLKTVQWCQKVIELGAGELLVTSMESDGEKKGFSTEIIQQIEQCTNVPIIASGGAGSIEDFVELFNTTNATGGLAASIFHFNEVSITSLKQKLKNNNISIR
jgi:cyclase